MIAPAGISVAEIDIPGEITALLARLNRGEVVGFSHEQGGPVAFTIEKAGRSFVMRDDHGRALASGATFAEAWRQRSRVADTLHRVSKKMDDLRGLR